MHSAKITACCSLTLDHIAYLVTCSDDTTVKISKLSPGSDTVCLPVSTMTRHVSNVKCCCLAMSLLTDGSHILITGGGRAQLAATLITPGKRDLFPAAKHGLILSVFIINFLTSQCNTECGQFRLCLQPQ